MNSGQLPRILCVALFTLQLLLSANTSGAQEPDSFVPIRIGRQIPAATQAQVVQVLKRTNVLGILTDIKRKTSTDFESLYKAAGLQGDEDVKVLAALYENDAGTSAGAYYMHAPEYIDGAYLEANQRFSLGADRYIQFSGQYTWQEPVGAELAGDIDAEHYGLRATWGHSWYSGSLAWTDYPDENRIRSPWGSIPGYTSVMIKDFDRPEEQA